ncbi:unnamed protein product [Mytilus coruscus]|uniref:Uncharacterized protein n=1 Tax=Mytilus coruscus TaxID=42192 RepID=A0A6J8EWR0_MYTCO|nr:unnamed protein product [Mytilus coruscus]
MCMKGDLWVQDKKRLFISLVQRYANNGLRLNDLKETELSEYFLKRMFHIDCPRFRGFMSWDELGCLARAVGFPTDLFKSNLTKHVTAEDHGMNVEQVHKMLDLRLLQKSIHRTRNLHTGEWNTKVIRKALFLMDHHALTFEEIYNMRIAYKAFEGEDMRGMPLEERMMLGALKMCGRSIAPLKMMHRIKHMSVHFEEPDRMQLFEFLDLVLWADLYEEFTFGSMEKAEGKEGDLFKLVDFERLLSHHDKKLEDRLNNEYLAEEWDFGQEKLDVSKFREPPVVCGDSRIQLARDQKLKYRYLKSELINSHRKLYRAKAGYIRDRPVTAPDLSMYEEQEAPPPQPEFTAQTAYEIVNRKVKSANAAIGIGILGNRKPKGRTQPDLSDKPHIPSPQKVWTAKAVSAAELEETQKNYDKLKFDMETVQGRYEYHKEKEIEYFFPGQLERLTKQQEEKEDVEVSEMKKVSSQSSKPKITQKEVNRLAYPPNRIPPTHAKLCDARFRGWHNIKHKKGSHFVLVAPSFENSYHGRLHKKLVERTNAPVKKVKGDFVHRFTKKTEVQKPINQDMRPFTAPGNLQPRGTDIEAVTNMITESPADSCKTVDTGYGSMEDKLGSGSSAESLVKSPDLQTFKSLDDKSQNFEQKTSCPKPFESQKVVEKNSKKDAKLINGSEESPERPREKNMCLRQTLQTVGSIDKEMFSREKSLNGTSKLDTLQQSYHQKRNESPRNNSSLKNNHTGNINGHNKYIQNLTGENTSMAFKTENDKTVCEKSFQETDLNDKIDNFKKTLNKNKLEKRLTHSQRQIVKSPPALEFTFTSVLNESDELDFKPVEVKTSKSAWFEDDIPSPGIMSPRNPEIYTKPKKEIIDIENLPVPHLEHSKPKTVSVGAIGKISLLESITESRFWEDVVEESYRSRKSDEVFFKDDLNVNLKEKELADLKEEDFDDDVSNDSGIGGFNKNCKPKNVTKKKSKSDNVDDKLQRAKIERLKRQKRVLKGSSFEKMGITVRSSRSSQTSSSSENSNKELDSKTKDQILHKKTSSDLKTNNKNDKTNEQKNVTIEISKSEKQNKNNKIEEKQRKFSASMKRLVKRMDDSLSNDLRSKMLSTHLS